MLKLTKTEFASFCKRNPPEKIYYNTELQKYPDGFENVIATMCFPNPKISICDDYIYIESAENIFRIYEIKYIEVDIQDSLKLVEITVYCESPHDDDNAYMLLAIYPSEWFSKYACLILDDNS